MGDTNGTPGMALWSERMSVLCTAMQRALHASLGTYRTMWL